MWSTRCFCQISMKLRISRQIFEKYWNAKFNGKPSSGCWHVLCGSAGRHDEASSRFSQFCQRAYNLTFAFPLLQILKFKFTCYDADSMFFPSYPKLDMHQTREEFQYGWRSAGDSNDKQQFRSEGIQTVNCDPANWWKDPALGVCLATLPQEAVSERDEDSKAICCVDGWTRLANISILLTLWSRLVLPFMWQGQLGQILDCLRATWNALQRLKNE